MENTIDCHQRQNALHKQRTLISSSLVLLIMVSVLTILPLFSSPVFVLAQDFCSTYADCTTCVQSSDNRCVWCATSNKCASIMSNFHDDASGKVSDGYFSMTNTCPISGEPISLFTEMCVDPLFEVCGNRALPNIVESNNTIFEPELNPTQKRKQQLKDISLCQQHKDCIADDNCVYIARGFFTVTTTSGDVPSRAIPIGINGTCWRALPVLGSPISHTVHRGGNLIYTLETEESYYATCVIREVYYWVIFGAGILAVVLCVCCGCVCCLCCFCIYCKRDRRYISLNA